MKKKIMETVIVCLMINSTIGFSFLSGLFVGKNLKKESVRKESVREIEKLSPGLIRNKKNRLIHI